MGQTIDRAAADKLFDETFNNCLIVNRAHTIIAFLGIAQEEFNADLWVRCMEWG